MPMLPAALPVWRVLSASGLAAKACREVAAGEMRPRRPGVSGPGHALEVGRAEGPAPHADPLGHLVHGIVQWHRVLPVIASRRPVDGGGVRPVEDQPDRGIGGASRSPCPLKRRTFARTVDQHEAPGPPRSALARSG